MNPSTEERFDHVAALLTELEAEARLLVQDLTVTGGHVLPVEIGKLRKLLMVLRKDYDDAHGGVCACGRKRPAHSPVCWLCHATGH